MHACHDSKQGYGLVMNDKSSKVKLNMNDRLPYPHIHTSKYICTHVYLDVLSLN